METRDLYNISVLCQKKIDIMNILKIFKYSDIKSFLVTLKILEKDKGLLSFPIKGYTLAFDVPYSQKNSILFSQLNKQVLKSKGKINKLSKINNSILNLSFLTGEASLISE